MHITLLYAGLLALWFLALSVKVIKGRTGPNAIHIGDGGDKTMLRLMRGHANFAEYVPLILVMMAMLESSGTPSWLMHVLGASLLVARLLHGYALSFTPQFVLGRVIGASVTLVLLLVGGGLCVFTGLR
jgi:uncharacterized membrane protein YecN with MAPEG domain